MDLLKLQNGKKSQSEVWTWLAPGKWLKNLIFETWTWTDGPWRMDYLTADTLVLQDELTVQILERILELSRGRKVC